MIKYVKQQPTSRRIITMKHLSFGQKLLLLRKNNKMSQRDFSEKLGIAFSSIARYENNQVLPNTNIMLKIAGLFNVSVDYLLKDIDEVLYAIQDKELLRQIAQADNLSDPARNSLKTIIQSFLDSQGK
jgi:transcriptional regulator with XRE-family HTH domain